MCWFWLSDQGAAEEEGALVLAGADDARGEGTDTCAQGLGASIQHVRGTRGLAAAWRHG